ncbi:MAG: polyprenyl synthetase family protein [Anaerolineales bacterium]|nr:polyprenyl synthetase family protein [Anaerolineales bacterium]
MPLIELELQQVVALADGPGLESLHQMLAYHMGWNGEGAGVEARGKRIRPCLVLLVAAAAGAEWQSAIPAAAAVELVHNFSLIHDDIEDNSTLRRGRPTLWVKWGVPQALNAGDAMFTLAHLAVIRLQETISPQLTLRAAHLLQETCLRLTQGQYMDIAYEKRGDLTTEAYWPMISGKTAALLEACTGLGALVAGVSDSTYQHYRSFGHYLGLAFQAQDDLLGIWGEAALTGKSCESDLLSGKMSLPILYGLQQGGSFAKRWAEGPITPDEAPALSAQLEQEGAREYTQAKADELTAQALCALHQTHPRSGACQALETLSRLLLRRHM